MDALTIARWIGAGVLGVACLHLSIVNWTALVLRWARPRAPSWIPILGGALGVAATLIEPTGSLARWWWAPLVFDAGCAPGLLSSILHCIVVRRRPFQ